MRRAGSLADAAQAHAAEAKVAKANVTKAKAAEGRGSREGRQGHGCCEAGGDARAMAQPLAGKRSHLPRVPPCGPTHCGPVPTAALELCTIAAAPSPRGPHRRAITASPLHQPCPTFRIRPASPLHQPCPTWRSTPASPLHQPCPTVRSASPLHQPCPVFISTAQACLVRLPLHSTSPALSYVVVVSTVGMISIVRTVSKYTPPEYGVCSKYS
jgi:hypothetical protein